jgi:hypothetical protein
MTPKEKAIQIYTKMYNEVYTSYGTDFVAKQCALIAVNEIIQHEKDNHFPFSKITDFLEEVKKEIEKL